MPPDPLQDERDRLAEQVSNVHIELLSTVDVAKDLAKELKYNSSQVKDVFEKFTSTKKAMADALEIVSKLGNEYLKQKTVLDRISQNNTQMGIYESAKNKLLKDQYDQYVEIGFTRAQALQTLGDEKQIYADITRRMESNLDYDRQSVTQEQLRLVTLIKEIEARKTITNTLTEVNSKLEQGNKQVQDAKVKATALSKIFSSMSGIPFLKDFLDFKSLSESFQKGFGTGIKDLGGQLKSIITNPLFWAAGAIVGIVAGFKALVKLAFDYDKLVTSIANNTALSKDSSIGLLDNFRKISQEGEKSANALNNGFLSVKNQANAMLELGNSLETNAMFSNEMIQNQILLTKQMKMSKEEATGIQKMSLLTGQSAEKILQTAMSQNKTAISYRKIFAEIANLNAEISTAYKNNPELIAKAVVEANKLGLSLEQTQKIASSLLNFESSISGELESELLLGKQFNFEKARALALDGKSAEAATELMNQIGGINELTKMNVIQRERLAASIGMSAEELSKSAREQAVLNSLGVQNKEALEERYEILRRNGDLAGLERLKAEAARKEGGQALLQDIARANLQERFAEAMEKIKQVFTEIAAGPMIRMVTVFARLMEHTAVLKAIMIALAAVVAGIAISMAAAAISATIATGGANLLTAGVIGGTIVGAAALYGLNRASADEDNTKSSGQLKPQTPSQAPNTLSSDDMASRISQTKVDDAEIAPSPNNLIQTPGGNVKPNKNDSILLSTKPGGLNNDNVVKKLEEMNNYMKQPKEIKNVVELNNDSLVKKISEITDKNKQSTEVKELKPVQVSVSIDKVSSLDNMVKELENLTATIKQPKEIKNVVEINNDSLVKKISEITDKIKQPEEIKNVTPKQISVNLNDSNLITKLDKLINSKPDKTTMEVPKISPSYTDITNNYTTNTTDNRVTATTPERAVRNMPESKDKNDDRIDRLISFMENNKDRPINVNSTISMDTVRVGTALGMSSRA